MQYAYVYSGQSEGHTAVSTKITGKFKSIWEIHSLLTIQDPWPRLSTQIWLAWGTPCYSNSEILELTEGLPWSPEAQTKGDWGQQPVEAASRPVANSTQRIMPSVVQLGTFRLLWLKFPLIFLHL